MNFWLRLLPGTGRKRCDAQHWWASIMNDLPPFARVRSRTVGGKALLRCFYPFAAMFGIAAFLGAVVLWLEFRGGTDPGVAGVWIFVALAHLPAALWLRALVGLVSVWHDASLQGLRCYAVTAIFIGFYGSAGLIFLCDFFLPAMSAWATDL